MNKLKVAGISLMIVIGISGCSKHKGYSTINTSCKEGNNLPAKYKVNKIIQQEKYYVNDKCHMRTTYDGGYSKNSGLDKDTE